MKEFLEFLKEWDTLLLFVGIPLMLIPIEVVARLIKTKNKRNPLYWIDLVFTTLVKVFYRRFQRPP